MATFLIAVIKYLEKSNTRETGFILSESWMGTTELRIEEANHGASKVQK